MKIKKRTFLRLGVFLLAGLVHTRGYSQENSTVKGSVVNEKGDYLQGASVIAIDKSNARAVKSVTDNDGVFKMDGLIVGHSYDFKSYSVGYDTGRYEGLKVIAGQANAVLIRLYPNSKTNLDEVVVVGYGTQRKANLSGAVSQISGAAFENRSMPNLTQGLQGQIPNLNLVMGDGKPTQSPTYNVRGTTSVGQGGSALVLIDGVEGDPSLLNPNDVASVTVLKDASSAAVYGARGVWCGIDNY